MRKKTRRFYRVFYVSRREIQGTVGSLEKGASEALALLKTVGSLDSPEKPLFIHIQH